MRVIPYGDKLIYGDALCDEETEKHSLYLLDPETEEKQVIS